MGATSRFCGRTVLLRRQPIAGLIQIAAGTFLVWYAVTGHAIGRAHAQTPTQPPAPAATNAHIVARTDPSATLGKPAAIDAGAVLKALDRPMTAEEKIASLGYEPGYVRTALAAYKSGHFDAGDAAAAQIKDPLVRTTVEWVALRNLAPGVGLDRLQTFAAAHPDWVAPNWLRHEIEARLIRVRDADVVLRFFTTRAPETASGKLALAKALKATGRTADGTKLARAVFREHDMPGGLAVWFAAEFGGDLTKGDYKYRADRFFYKGRVAAALRDAAVAGPDVLAIARVRAALLAPRAKALDTVPDAWRTDPGLSLAQAHRLRHAGKPIAAARLLRAIAETPAVLADGDEWWTERRVLARELLDAGKPNAAYITCALHGPASRGNDVEAEFHAGWIALRFLHDAERAAYHFAKAAGSAQTPAEQARIAYWRGRTADASTDAKVKAGSKPFLERAASYGSTYYGQLARQTLGRPVEIVREPTIVAAGPARIESIRVIELLYAAGDKDSASALAVAATGELSERPQVGALAAVVAAQEDAHLSLVVGKLFARRGIALDSLAFPTFGVPAYKELSNSAALPVVYSVARQESAFITRAVSYAHANGLMQMIDATAWATARKAGLPFSHARLINDPAYNAQLGAAHLGTLMSEHDGSFILTFAAYNAGGGRVKQWIDAYGDPRKPGVDPIDWVERIPFSETRDYVQRVVENVGMYNALFAEKARGGVMARGGGQAGL